MHTVCLSIQCLDKLRIDHADEIIEGFIRVRDAAEQRDFAFAQFLQVQFVCHGQLGNGRQVECGKAHSYTY